MGWAFDHELQRCPFTITSNLSIFSTTNSEVNPGHVAKKPAPISFLHIFGTGLNAALYKKEMMYYLFFNPNKLFDRINTSVSSKSYSNVARHRLPVKYTLPYFSILDSFFVDTAVKP